MNTTTISSTQARNNFSDLISRVTFQHEQFFIHRQGKPVAILMPIDRPQKTTSNKSTSIAIQLTQCNLGIKDWEQAKALLSDLHRPKI
jgi:prevent-host-death family protein